MDRTSHGTQGSRRCGAVEPLLAAGRAAALGGGWAVSYQTKCSPPMRPGLCAPSMYQHELECFARAKHSQLPKLESNQDAPQRVNGYVNWCVTEVRGVTHPPAKHRGVKTQKESEEP